MQGCSQASEFRGWSLRLMQRKQKNAIQLLRLLQAEFQVWCWCLETVLSFGLGWRFIQAARGSELKLPLQSWKRKWEKKGFSGKKWEKEVGHSLGGVSLYFWQCQTAATCPGSPPLNFPVRHFGLRRWLCGRSTKPWCRITIAAKYWQPAPLMDFIQ